jgi:hypothetical protein
VSQESLREGEIRTWRLGCGRKHRHRRRCISEETQIGRKHKPRTKNESHLAAPNPNARRTRWQTAAQCSRKTKDARTRTALKNGRKSQQIGNSALGLWRRKEHDCDRDRERDSEGKPRGSRRRPRDSAQTRHERRRAVREPGRSHCGALRETD